jgi:ABC-2 type transport system permease protein
MGRVTAQNVMPLVGDIGICALFGIATLLVGLVLGRSRGRSELA